MHRLYVQIYVTIIASLIFVVVVSGAAWRFAGSGQFERDAFNIAEKLAANSLAEISAPVIEQQRSVRKLAEMLELDLALYNRNKNLVASWGNPLPVLAKGAEKSDKMRGWGNRAWQLKLPDQRWLVTRLNRSRTHYFLAPVAFFGSVALIVGLCAYPLVRRLTGRLERLQRGVERVGSGDFSTRVAIEGKDEVARLATSFNKAAEKIEKLLGAHRKLLANASHELRTPLSRIRLGIDLYKGPKDGPRKAALEQDIRELDQLVDEILLMSQLDANTREHQKEPVDLLAVAAEECARYEDCATSGTSVEIFGNARLLQRLVRNLVENAHRHGLPPVEMRVSSSGNNAVIEVLDHGSGIPEDQREKVFAPFYRMADRQDVKGYGLGLALVDHAEAHDGKVSIFEDTEDGLFGVRVTLPVQPSAR